MFGIPQEGEVDYTTVLNLDLETITPSVAGPKRPQDRIELSNLDDRFIELFHQAGCRRRLRQKQAKISKNALW